MISPRELVIFNVRPEEEGFYFCMAKNEVGEITSRFGQLNVQSETSDKVSNVTFFKCERPKVSQEP